MEVDAINNALAANSTQALDQQSLGLNKKPARALDLSQEHTNGRMFEQAVQNANKAGETSASSSDNVKLSNSKVDGNTDAKNENPLILNQKDARMAKDEVEPKEAEEDNTGQTCLKHALKTFGINYEALSQFSHDTIRVKGKAIDTLLEVNNESYKPNTKPDSEHVKLGVTSNITETQINRNKVYALAEETYHEVTHLEHEEGNHFQTSIIQGMDELSYAKEVVSLVFDRPVHLTIEKSK